MSTKLRHVVVGLKKRLCSSVIMDFVGDLSLMSCLMVQYYLQKQAGWLTLFFLTGCDSEGAVVVFMWPLKEQWRQNGWWMKQLRVILKVKCVTILVSCAEIRISKTILGYPNKFIGGEAEFSAANLLDWISVYNLQRNKLHFKILINSIIKIEKFLFYFFTLFSFPLY